MPSVVKASRPAGESPPAPKLKTSTTSSLRGDLKRFTRERLITAAMDSFASEGFRATTVERIVEMAGTTTPTFYRHFSSKNDLLEPLQAKLTLEVRVVVMALNEMKNPSVADIRGWIDRYVEMWLRIHQLCIAYWEAVEIDPALARDIFPSSLLTISKLDHFLDAFVGAEREAVSIILALLIPLLDRVTKVVTSTADPKMRDRILDELAKMIVLSIRNPGPID